MTEELVDRLVFQYKSHGSLGNRGAQRIEEMSQGQIGDMEERLRELFDVRSDHIGPELAGVTIKRELTGLLKRFAYTGRVTSQKLNSQLRYMATLEEDDLAIAALEKCGHFIIHVMEKLDAGQEVPVAYIDYVLAGLTLKRLGILEQ